jgi:hypothetical protein
VISPPFDPPGQPAPEPVTRYGTWVRPPGPAPLAYQLGDQKVLCSSVCLRQDKAQEMADAGEHVGDVQPWTVDLDDGDDDLRCDGCGAVLVEAPRYSNEDELEDEGAEQ